VNSSRGPAGDRFGKAAAPSVVDCTRDRKSFKGEGNILDIAPTFAPRALGNPLPNPVRAKLPEPRPDASCLMDARAPERPRPPTPVDSHEPSVSRAAEASTLPRKIGKEAYLKKFRGLGLHRPWKSVDHHAPVLIDPKAFTADTAIRPIDGHE